MNICIALIFCFTPEFRERTAVVYTNLLIGLFNLIPIYPLDGGRALSAILKSFLDGNMANKMTHIISNTSMFLISIVAFLGTIYLKNIAIIAIVVYLWTIVIMENRKYKLKQRMYQIIKKIDNAKIS